MTKGRRSYLDLIQLNNFEIYSNKFRTDREIAQFPKTGNLNRQEIKVWIFSLELLPGKEQVGEVALGE